MSEREEAPAANEGQSKDSQQSATSKVALRDIAEDPVEFLKWWSPEGPWVLVAIVPDGKISAATFRPNTEQALEEWLKTRIGRENIYFHVNHTGDRHLTKKAEKKDIVEARWLHVDVDPVSDMFDEERVRILQRLKNHVPPPTCIIDSGGGYQAFWKLSDPTPLESVEDAEEFERYNRQLEIDLGGDHCHNVDRIMRLPGTINVPNKKKRKKGRVERPTKVVAKKGLEYQLNQFTPAATIETSNEEARPVSLSDDLPIIGDVKELDMHGALSPRMKMVIVQGDDPDKPYPSRSEAVFAVVCEMVRGRFSDDFIAGVLLDPDFGISESVQENKNPRTYAARQIERARATAEHDAFETDKDGKPVPTIRNVGVAFRKMGVEVSHDQFASRYRVEGLDGHGLELTDEAERALRIRFEERFGLKYARERLSDIVRDMAFNNGHHPVREYLDGLSWDRVPRVERWLIDVAGAENNEYVQAVSRLVLVAAVRRVRKPGSKFDELLVLEGSQGGDKSSALRRLAVREDWFSEDLPLTGDSKMAIEQTAGKWIIEAAELKGLGRNIDQLKNFLSMQKDRARMAYGRTAQDHPRQWIVIGTTNKDEYLRDPTGNRRFWPVRVGAFDLTKMTAQYVDQLWAEASKIEAEGASIRLDPVLYNAAAEQQRAREEEDPWEEQIRDWVGDGQSRILSSDLWRVVGIDMERREQRHNTRLGAIMRRLGFERKRFRVSGKVKLGYVRGDGEVLAAPTRIGEVVLPKEDIPF